MGKFRNKMKGKTKGKRWPKGQSSSSNPEIHKYRNQAKSRFFQENFGPTFLTHDALRKHDAVQSVLPKTSENNIEMEYEESSVGSYQTMKTFASDWSECSNVSFNRFLKIFRPDSALHKEMLAVLAAIAEVIKENGGNETPTEYYCALLTTLEQVYNQEPKNIEQITAVLSLINMGIKTVPECVLRKNFNDVLEKMLLILNDFVNLENNAIIKSLMGILAVLLGNQEVTWWIENTLTNKIFEIILNTFCLHTKPKWRKSGQDAVTLIVKSKCFNETSINPAADIVAKFCLDTLERCLGGSNVEVLVSSVQVGQTTILHILGFMKDTICKFSKSNLKKSCEILLRLIILNYPLVTSCSLQVLHALFSNQTAVVPAKLNLQIIEALYDFQPSPGDIQPTLAWLIVMQQAHIHLADVDLDMAIMSFPRIFLTMTQLWLSSKDEITTATTHSLEILLRDGLAPACVTLELVEKYKTKLIKCFSLIESGLSYQYHSIWNQVLYLIKVMFEISDHNCKDLFINCLKTLADIRDSYKFSFNNELEHAVGAAIRSLGPEIVLNIIKLTKNDGELNLNRSWLLPVLKENIKFSTLDYFIKSILPLALFSQKKSKQLAAMNDGIGSHSAELLYIQLWNLLPCFCNNPSDITANFKSLAKVLGMAISDKKELRLTVMTSLRRLINYAKENKNIEDLSELSRFDKNYLPILFNVYITKPIGTDEEGQRLAALDTIKCYLSIAKFELTEQLLINAIERLNSSSDDPEDGFIKESIFDLLRVLVPYQNIKNIGKLYEECIKPLPNIKHNKEQKKAYRLLEEICASTSENCKEFVTKHYKEVQKLLMKALNSSMVSSKGARLRCLNYLIKSQPQLDHESKLLRSVIPEAVLACKDINEKTRHIAYELLNTIGDILLKHNQTKHFLSILMTGLAGTYQLISCTILALASVLHNFSGSLGQENIKTIFDNIMILMTSHTREIVGSCLSFLKVYCQIIPSPIVGASLPNIIKSLTSMTDDCKRHFRLKSRNILDRLIRKYGYESITPHIPINDTVMYKRIRNLRKLNIRKKKLKEVRQEQLQSSSNHEDFLIKSKLKSVDEILADSDSDFDYVEDENIDKSTKKRTINTWIEEDSESIVDFTDPAVVSKITATKPGTSAHIQIEKKKIKNRGFKTAPDGRLIIKDDSSDDNDDDNIKINKFDSDSDENDKNSVAETLRLSDRKRKHKTSVKSGLSRSSTCPPMKYKAGGIGIHRPLSTSSIRSGLSSVGSKYQSKKAKGDVKKKNKLDPYAYLPLQRKALNKRKQKKFFGQFKNIVKSTRAGSKKVKNVKK